MQLPPYLDENGFYEQLHNYWFGVFQKKSFFRNPNKVLENEFELLRKQMIAEAIEAAAQRIGLSVFNEAYKGRFRDMSDEQLIDTFNKEMDNPEWVSSRELFQIALYDEFDTRNYDYSDIDTGGEGLSFTRKIKLLNKKIILV